MLPIIKMKYNLTIKTYSNSLSVIGTKLNNGYILHPIPLRQLVSPFYVLWLIKMTKFQWFFPL